MGPQCWPFMSYEATGAFIFLSRSKQSESFIFIYYMICFFVVKIYQYKISFLDRFDSFFLDKRYGRIWFLSLNMLDSFIMTPEKKGKIGKYF